MWLPNEALKHIDPDYLWFQKPPGTQQAFLLVCSYAMVGVGAGKLVAVMRSEQMLSVCLKLMSKIFLDQSSFSNGDQHKRDMPVLVASANRWAKGQKSRTFCN